MPIHAIQASDDNFPKALTQLAQPITKLYVRGNLKALQLPALAVVGSRAVTNYGAEVTTRLINEVAWQSNIAIVSGLALGVDSLAHKAALAAHGTTIAVLPSGIEGIYPASHQRLAEQIIAQGGAVVSEYAGVMSPQKFHFIARNRIIAGLSQVIIITEATQKSGSLHTAQFGLEGGKEVLAIPGDIFRPNSVGTNNLIANGAHPVRSAQDILNFFNTSQQIERGDNQAEDTILKLLRKGQQHSQQLYQNSHLDVQVCAQTMTMLEIKGRIKNNRHGQWSIV
ncbi:MAG: DNA-processing protein DprA [Candidatus Saccharimonadales bacterium]